MSCEKQRAPSDQVVAALQNQGPKFSFEIQKLPIPTIKPQEVLVELEVTGVCGTDLSLAHGYLGPCQTILGHEGVGRIAAVGSLCKSQAATVGRLVGVGWIRDACGFCHVCDNMKDETRCLKQVFSGRDVPGTLARYTVVPERYITPLPDGVPSEMLAPIMCAGVTAYKAIKVANLAAGSWVGISGAAGGVGSLALSYAKHMGYRPIAIDGGEKGRLICMDAGAEIYLNFEKEDNLRSAVLLQTEGKLCSAIIVCAGAAAAYEEALSCLDYHGTLVAVGIPPPTSKISLHPLSLIDYGIRIIGSITGDRVDIAEAAEFVRKGLVKPRVTEVGIHELDKYVGRVNELDGKLVVRLGAKVGRRDVVSSM
ncbi:alcohol dehydrogenase [Penicillium concentricum]|uniref:Alcohol dehydrogenase n=1 Tax=Penicillium concentricum TaxID=293559 RepID=A0A9W9RHE3_9EURO|nr:alcohol dehydrogenase [Penicillium concentricum]KAJ5360322.1 alcohol dehydrogenase [Penicillium concentricum]